MALADTTVTETIAGKEAEDRVAVASNWRLVWWRFRRHHLAMASAGAADLPLPRSSWCPISSRPRTPNAPTRARPSFRCRWCICSTTAGSRPGSPPSSASATPRPCAWNGRPIRRRRCRCASSRRVQLERVFGLFETNLHLIVPADPDAAHLPAGLRPAGPRSVVAHHARHADLDDRRPGGGGAQRHPGRRAGRHLGLCRRQDRPGDPAPDRAAAVGADHPDLAGAVGRPAARLDADPGLLRHHRDPVAGRLDDAWAARCAAASSPCARRISCWPPASPAARACASSCATWCRPS